MVNFSFHQKSQHIVIIVIVRIFNDHWRWYIFTKANIMLIKAAFVLSKFPESSWYFLQEFGRTNTVCGHGDHKTPKYLGYPETSSDCLMYSSPCRNSTIQTQRRTTFITNLPQYVSELHSDNLSLSLWRSKLRLPFFSSSSIYSRDSGLRISRLLNSIGYQNFERLSQEAPLFLEWFGLPFRGAGVCAPPDVGDRFHISSL